MSVISVDFGENVTIIDPINLYGYRICDVVIGAGAVVTRDINEAGIYAGNPAKKIRGFR